MANRVGALLLAAGFSSRFGGIKLNARLDNGNTVFAQTRQRLCAGIAEVLVITRPELAHSLAESAGSVQVFDGADAGMGATLAYGIGLASDWDACLICLADMPFIESSTYTALARRARDTDILQPRYAGKPGNPVVFGRRFYKRLGQLQGDSGGRQLIKQYQDNLVTVDLDDPGILQDIDTPDDLAALQKPRR